MLEVNNQEGGNGRERERKIRNSYLPSLELIVGLDNGMITLPSEPKHSCDFSSQYSRKSLPIY